MEVRTGAMAGRTEAARDFAWSDTGSEGMRRPIHERVKQGETVSTEEEWPEQQEELGYDRADEINPVLAQAAHT